MPEAGVVACQSMYWFMKSYSTHAFAPSLIGSNEGVATSKTPHPQAQAQVRVGAIITRRTAAIISNPLLRDLDRTLTIRSENRCINLLRRVSAAKMQSRDAVRVARSGPKNVVERNRYEIGSLGGGVSGATR